MTPRRLVLPGHQRTDALPETNIAPENGWLEDESSFWDGVLSGAMSVLGSVIRVKG